MAGIYIYRTNAIYVVFEMAVLSVIPPQKKRKKEESSIGVETKERLARIFPLRLDHENTHVSFLLYTTKTPTINQSCCP